MTDIAQTKRSGLRLRPNAWLASVLLLALVALIDWPQFWPTVIFAANALMHTAPFILFAVFAVAYLKASGAETLLARAFEGNPVRMVIFAALLAACRHFVRARSFPSLQLCLPWGPLWGL